MAWSCLCISKKQYLTFSFACLVGFVFWLQGLVSSRGALTSLWREQFWKTLLKIESCRRLKCSHCNQSSHWLMNLKSNFHNDSKFSLVSQILKCEWLAIIPSVYKNKANRIFWLFQRRWLKKVLSSCMIILYTYPIN